ncbi:hypothetical protein [Prosthecochloris sp.]|uniref:hypothetical protein n=1 Tax=Prosthecochloris sp. TaxID=290513 RepID=UPI00257E0FC3|nr:hypothetical protein [Prosthecochloris sp.]
MAKSAFTFVAFCMSIFLLNPHSSKAESPAKTQSVVGSTNISIVLPDLIILHYYSGLTLNFEEFSSAEDRGSADFDVQWNGDAESTSQLNDENTEIDLPDRVSLQLPNVWAIRGLSPSGNAKVSISLNNNVLTSGSSRIIIEEGEGNIQIEDNAGHSGTTINTSLKGITSSEATIGNVRITLNFSETTKAGLHTGGQYKITAETI